MKAFSPIRILRVPRRGSHLSACPSDSAPLPLLQPPSSPYFFAVTSFCAPGVRWCTLALGRGEPRRRSFPSLNLHRARVRRKLGGQVQRLNRTRAEHPAFTYPRKRASDSALAFIRVDARASARGGCPSFS